MSLTRAEIQQALRISKAVQEHLETTTTVNVPSADLYGVLVKRELVERDADGRQFRQFLTKLTKANMLNLIPQCNATARAGGKFDFTFNRAADRMPVRKPAAADANAVVSPSEA